LGGWGGNGDGGIRWQKIEEGSGDFDVQGGWTESQEEGGGSGVLELGREGAEQQRGAGRRLVLLNALCTEEGKKGGEGGVGSVPYRGRRRAEREGPGCGVA
jgi:hypothetical protein